jgi:hypothetical protein
MVSLTIKVYQTVTAAAGWLRSGARNECRRAEFSKRDLGFRRRRMRGDVVACAAAVFLGVAAAAGPVAGAALPPNAPLPPPRPDWAQPGPPPPSAQEQAGGAEGECLATLDRLAVRYEHVRPLSDGPCGAPTPLRISRLGEGVALSPPSTMTCGTAQALAHWVLDVVMPEADHAFGKPASSVSIGTSYECRGQNRRAGAKLSEHAFAAAVDVMGFALGPGKTVTVGSLPPETPESRFLAAVRSGACRYFSTVLGPGSDPEHATHLHLDLRVRKAGYRICQ